MSHPNFLAKSSIEEIALSEKSLPSTTTSAGEPGPGSGCSFLTTKHEMIHTLKFAQPQNL